MSGHQRFCLPGATLVVLVSVAASLVFPTSARAASPEALTGAGILELPPEASGQTVVLEGEAVGDILRADQGRVWVNLLSEGVAIGVWTPRDPAEQIETLGAYQRRGDIVRAIGTFNFACDQHGGDLDIHAESFEVIERGGRIERPVNAWKGVAAVVLGAIALTQAAMYRKSRRRQPWL